MLGWLHRVFRRYRDDRSPDDPRLRAQAEAHARAMQHARKASPGDPVIRAEASHADAMLARSRVDREMRAADVAMFGQGN